MSGAARAADIRICIHCFTACGAPCGAIGRATAVSCGVCLHGCRGECWGLGTCVVGLVRCLAGLCTVICKGIVGLCTVICKGIASLLGCIWVGITLLFVPLLVVGSLGVVALLGYLYWDPIVHFFETVKNETTEYYDKTLEDPRVVHLWNKTEEYYEATKDKFVELGNHPEVQQIANKTEQLYDISKTHIVHAWNNKDEYLEATKDKFVELGNHPEVQRVGAKTVELYDAAKDQIGDTYEKVRQYEAVQSAVNGTISFFGSLKSKIWG